MSAFGSAAGTAAGTAAGEATVDEARKRSSVRGARNFMMVL